MPTVDDHPPGTPSWVDLASTDLPAALGFYTALFGRTAEDQGPDSGHYHMLTKGGRPVAGAMATMAEGQPSFWTTYVSVASADATTKVIEDAGGSVVVEPMDVLTAGRMVVAADPAGAPFGLWQPRHHRGAGLLNEPGALTWNELNTRHLESALAFYPKVFGWEPETHTGAMAYTEWRLGGRSVAGTMAMPEAVPPEVPSHWLVYFATADCDTTVSKAADLGATTTMPPTDVPAGRFAVLIDPTGAVFAVIATQGS